MRDGLTQDEEEEEEEEVDKGGLKNVFFGKWFVFIFLGGLFWLC